MTLLKGKTSKLHKTGEEVEQLQEMLDYLGYYNGDIDGVFGRRTLSAVKKFQSDNDLLIDGTVGPLTIEALNAVYEEDDWNDED